MDFYEELGVGLDASAEQIHSAYKRLAKQYHPDKRSNAVQRRWAEAQMRRLNEIFETLSAPERRARYDESLRSAAISQIADWQAMEAIEATRIRRRRLIAVLGLSLAGLVCAGFVLITLLDRQVRQPATPPAAPETLTTAVRPVATASSADREKQTVSVVDAQPASSRASVSALEKTESSREGPPAAAAEAQSPAPPLPISLLPPVSEPPSLNPPRARLSGAAEDPSPPSTAELPGRTAAREAVEQRKTVAGTWIFSQSRGSKSRGVETHLPFNAEYVEVSVKVANERVDGRFRGEYNVRTSTLPPRVQFHFEGRESDLAAGIAWKAEDGAEGLIKFHLLSDSELEIGWYTTRFASSPALTSGEAILSREPSPEQ